MWCGTLLTAVVRVLLSYVVRCVCCRRPSMQEASARDDVRADLFRGGNYRRDLVGVLGHHFRRRPPSRRRQRECSVQSSCPVPSHTVIFRPVQSYPTPSRPILSRPISSHPIPSHPMPSHPISSHPIPSYPIASRLVTYHPIPRTLMVCVHACLPLPSGVGRVVGAGACEPRLN